MTLTDEEKNEIRQSDDRAWQILERTDAMPAEQFMKLHGAMRGMRPLKEDNP
jgi:hydrogenase maturation protease